MTERAGTSASTDVLIRGLGLRLNGAPIGYCTVVLVTAADGRRILVDTGVHQTRDVLLDALRTRALTPSDIDAVVLTHLHFDHCENLALFPDASVVLHEQEIRECEDHPTRDRYVADFWRELVGSARVELMTGPSMALGAGVEARHLPGHRHGLITVCAETAGGLAVCSSDAARNARELLERRSVVSDSDMIDASRRSIEEILEMADLVLPGHDRPMAIIDRRPVWFEDQEINVNVY